MRRTVALLAATLAVVLAAGPANGGPVSASDRSTVDKAVPVDVTAAAPPRQDVTTQATVGLRVISHNICGGASCGHQGATAPLSSVTTLIDNFRPHVFMLQEVCWSQYQYLQSHAFSSGPYQMGFTVMIHNYAGCGVSDCSVNEDEDPANDDKRCWTGQLLAARGTLSNRDEIPLGGERHQVGNTGSPVNPPRKFNALCYDVALADLGTRVVKGCTVHMRAFQDPAGESKRARTAQTARLASDLDGDIAAGKIVVVGGDFNSRPIEPAMNAFYRLDTDVENSWGRFYEADQDDKNYYASYCSSTAAACRSGARTIGAATKYDYIFYSETTDPASVSGLPIDEAMSDHWFYRGLANVSTS